MIQLGLFGEEPEPSKGFDRSAYQRKWRLENPEKVKEYHRSNLQRTLADPVKRQEYYETYHARMKRLRATDEGKQLLSERARKFRELKADDVEYRAAFNVRRRDWYQRTIEERRMCGRIIAHKRRTLIKTAGNFTKEDIENLLIRQECRCAACHKSLRRGYEIDHVLPVSRGGSNTVDNLQLLCERCNRSKADMMPEEWAAKCGLLFV